MRILKAVSLLASYIMAGTANKLDVASIATDGTSAMAIPSPASTTESGVVASATMSPSSLLFPSPEASIASVIDWNSLVTDTYASTYKIEEDARPSDYEYALMSEHVYLGTALSPDMPLPGMEGWDLLSVQAGTMDFFAASYINRETRQLVVAYRGTDSLAGLWEDLWGIANPKGFSPQKEQAFKYVREALAVAKKNRCHLSFTGHSLGAFLAELSVFYCRRVFHFEANAVTFESPGSRPTLIAYQSNLEPEKINLDELDVRAYLSTPNLINTCNNHFGSLYATSPDLGDYGNWAARYLKKAHSMNGLVRWLEGTEASSFNYICDWPIGSQRDIFFKYAVFRGGHYSLSSEATLIETERSLLDSKMHELYERSFKGHHCVDELLSGPHAIPLKHFRQGMQLFLKAFYQSLSAIAKNPRAIDQLIQKSKALKISDEILRYLLSYRLEVNDRGLAILRLDESLEMEKFRRELSRFLAVAKNGETVSELLKAAGSSSQATEIMASVIAPGGRLAKTGVIEDVSVIGVSLNIPEGAAEEDIANLQRLVNSMMSQSARISVHVVAPDAIVEGKITGSRVKGIDASLDAAAAPRFFHSYATATATPERASVEASAEETASQRKP